MTGCGKSLRGDAAALFFAVCQLPVIASCPFPPAGFCLSSGEIFICITGKKRYIKDKTGKDLKNE